jgi:hypothetical protein
LNELIIQIILVAIIFSKNLFDAGRDHTYSDPDYRQGKYLIFRDKWHAIKVAAFYPLQVFAVLYFFHPYLWLPIGGVSWYFWQLGEKVYGKTEWDSAVDDRVINFFKTIFKRDRKNNGKS